MNANERKRSEGIPGWNPPREKVPVRSISICVCLRSFAANLRLPLACQGWLALPEPAIVIEMSSFIPLTSSPIW